MIATRKNQSEVITEKNRALRNKYWPKISDDMLWDHNKKGGYAYIPRTMPYILLIMNFLSIRKPVGNTYLALWFRHGGIYFVTIESPQILAFESGFTGQRAQNAWGIRMKILEDLGFIDVKPGISGPFHYVLIKNPQTVIEELYKKREHIPTNIMNAFLERKTEVEF